MKKMLLVSMVLAAGLLTTGCTSSNTTKDTVMEQSEIMNQNVVGVTSDSDDGNVAENVLDGDLSTRWSSANDSWLILELDKTSKLTEVKIAFSKGNERTANFALEVSTDGEKWKRVFDGTSTGTTKELESFPVSEKAKFVKFVGWGNSYNEWNSITSVEIMGK